ncbi:succinyldiaminopimelate transaminase [Curtobacterium citreum]|uniref:Aminotransferase n=1 Tax=Curtobacterium citreum TaxID=2036 RepID=A0ABT2HEY3_9MICO|nr:succinyldiaminopimelate transaminase [Curtobacterium citreum]MCS6521832.1 succinyldiaminopimelate transaminase [Curtobacterium citreum]TQJ27223.1 succinyldiaminopimelate aminotransferase [Curtobacterium citreum]GGL73097.1 succinyldiaminopimelate transaminase [Curtobacterium citreum]
MALDLPDFPWDQLVPFKQRAAASEGGIVDLSVGSPVDPTPEVVRRALADATDAHAYPQVAGTPALREAIADWYGRRQGITLTPDQVLPTIGSKEFIAGLALWLGIGPGDTVVFPEAAYPTYELGAALVRAEALAADDPATWPATTRLVWLNSPGNPDGRVLSVERLRAAVARARELGAVVVGDECYAELGWEPPFDTAPTPSILDPRVVGDSVDGVLSVYSLSKQSNLAGYRAAFVAGDAAVLADVLAVRKHTGMMPPLPVQQAMVEALADDTHVQQQKARYRARRNMLRRALEDAGFRIDHSEAGLYLWATRGEPALDTVSWLADRGILVAPGTFYGPAGAEHVRVALTATDDRIAAAAQRLASARRLAGS